jgi:hypothetical protein
MDFQKNMREFLEMIGFTNIELSPATGRFNADHKDIRYEGLYLSNYGPFAEDLVTITIPVVVSYDYKMFLDKKGFEYTVEEII